MTDSLTFRNEDLPALFHHTDQAAISRQRESTQATRAQLLLLVAAAGAAALPPGPKLGPLHFFGLLSALAYAGVLGVGVRATRRRPPAVAAQPQCRRVHQVPGLAVRGARGAVRERGPRSRGGVPDAAGGGSGGAAEDGLGGSAGVRGGAGGAEITGAMRRLRESDYQARRETYVRDRLIEQRNWYRRRTEVSRRATHVWSWTIVLLTCLALLFSLLGALDSGPGAGTTGVLSAAAAAGIAWNEVRRHHPLIEAHSLIEQDLAAMMVVMQTTITESQWPSSVYETERYVSPQHTDWLARHSS